MTKQELIDIIEEFRQRVKVVACYWKLYCQFCNHSHSYSEGIKRTPAFWTITSHAYIHATMTGLAQLYDRSSDVYGVETLLKVCKNNKALFIENDLPCGERYATSQEAAEFLSLFEEKTNEPLATGCHFLDELSKEYEEKATQIENLRRQRNKLWVHSDKKWFLNPSEFEKQNLLTDADIDSLVEFLVDISNTLLNHLGKEVSGIYPANIDDILILLNTIQRKATAQDNV